MIQTVQDIYMQHFAWWMYFGPLLVNAIWYTVDTWIRVQTDRRKVALKKENPKEFVSTYDFITIGTLFWYLFLTITPIINAFAMIFDAAPSLAQRVYNKFEWLFEIKLVKPE